MPYKDKMLDVRLSKIISSDEINKFIGVISSQSTDYDGLATHRSISGGISC